MAKGRFKQVFLSVALGFMTASGGAMAHEEGKGPHGGVVKEFGNYHLEAVKQDGSLKFYLLDGDGVKSASVESTGGSITVAGGGGPKVTKIESGKFSEASATVEGQKAVATVMLKIAGKAQTVKFSFK